MGSSLVALDSIIEVSKKTETLENGEVSMIMLFDHEEVGSQSAQGADSNMAAEITQRIFESLSQNSPMSMSEYYRAIRQSFLVSADMAHGVHPNYSEKHQPLHQPKIHQGIVIKTNANQRYMTDTVSSTIMRAVAERAGVPMQDFIVKNDSACGSTIGPMMAAKAGIKTVDIGAPMLGMHSIRETCGVIDMLYYQKLFTTFFTDYSQIPTALLSE